MCARKDELAIDWSKISWYERVKPASEETEPRVTVGKTGRLSLNAPAIALYYQPPALLQIGVHTGARGKKILILRAVEKGVADASSVKVGTSGKRFVLNTTRFFTDKELTAWYGQTATKVEYDQTHDALLVSFGS